MSLPIRIDRCYCFDVTFARLKGIADETGATNLADLQREATFGEQCRLCHPYVRRMLLTGEVVFGELVVEDGVEE